MHPFDEMYTMTPFDGSDVRLHYKDYAQWLARQSEQTLRARSAEAEIIFRRVGITFAVYGDKDESGAGNERLIPFDLIPRVIPDRKSTRLNSSHLVISYAVFCLKKKKRLTARWTSLT